MNQILISLIQLLKKLEELIEQYRKMNNRTKLYEAAVSFLGADASPRDLADDELGCAESVNEIHKKVFGTYISPQNILSTYRMYEALTTDPRFVKVDKPQEGTIVISPTGYSSKGAKNGHVGICGKNDIIMSSDSRSGLWLENYTIRSWESYYVVKLGFPIHYFNRL